jgi:aminopeptidase C
MDEHQHLNMSVSTLQVTSIPEISGTKIFSFGCRVPANLQQHDPSLMSDENVDFDDALKIQSMDNKSAKLLQQSDVELIEKNGIVGTVTIFGRSTAMVWVGWGRLHEQHSQDVSEIITQRSLGSGT